MENQLEIQSSYDSLDKVMDFLKNEISYQRSKVNDKWEVVPGKLMEKCILVKKNAMIGLKVHFSNKNILRLVPVVPSLYLLNYTVGRGFLPPIVRAIIHGSQKKILAEVSDKLMKIKY